MTDSEKKLFLGARLKRLRRDLGLTQTRMAEDVGISPSYLNHLERNQRPVTAQILLKLAEVYEIDMRSLSAEADLRDAAQLSEVFADALFKDMPAAKHEIAEVAENAPSVADAIVRLYQAYANVRASAAAGEPDSPSGAAAPTSTTPTNWVRDAIQARANYFAELDESGERLAGEMASDTQDFPQAMRERLQTRHSIGVRIVQKHVLPDSMYRYDPHRKRLYLSEMLDPPGRAFALAYRIAALEHDEVLRALVAQAGPPDPVSGKLFKVSLANYLAGAILMPYDDFYKAAEGSAYDIDLLRARFGVSFEQAAHRLTTLARPGQRGVPFFLLRVDSAGNISKRFASGAFPFSRFGGTCPRWNIHAAFRAPGKIITQVIENTDGARYFTLSRTVKRITAQNAAEDTDLAIGLGCELKHAGRLIYANGLNLGEAEVTPVGPACRLCDRPACPQRAAEPAGRTLLVDDFTKSVSPYPFVTR